MTDKLLIQVPSTQQKPLAKALARGSHGELGRSHTPGQPDDRPAMALKRGTLKDDRNHLTAFKEECLVSVHISGQRQRLHRHSVGTGAMSHEELA